MEFIGTSYKDRRKSPFETVRAFLRIRFERSAYFLGVLFFFVHQLFKLGSFFQKLLVIVCISKNLHNKFQMAEGNAVRTVFC